jgi:ABC-type sulfate transport system permease subunit
MLLRDNKTNKCVQIYVKLLHLMFMILIHVSATFMEVFYEGYTTYYKDNQTNVQIKYINFEICDSQYMLQIQYR